MRGSEAWIKRLLREMPDEPTALLRRSAYWQPAFLSAYLGYVDGLIFDDPRGALPWAEVGPKLALLVPDGKAGSRQHGDCLAMSHAVLGGALRATGQHDRAEAEYRSACQIADSGASEDVQVEVKGRLAILRACQGRFDEALTLGQTAVTHFRNSNHDWLGDALARQGYMFCEAGRFGEAIPYLGEALILSEPKLSAVAGRVHHTAAHNLASAILHTSRQPLLKGALAQVRSARKLLRPHRDNVPRHKLGWLEGLVWRRLEIHPAALRAFRTARNGFIRFALPFEIALVSLDLAELHYFLSEFSQAAEVAHLAFEHFEALNADRRGTLAALTLWLKAIEAQDLTDEITNKARRMIEARIGPGGCCRTSRKGPKYS